MKLLLFDFGSVIVGLDKYRCMRALEQIGCKPIVPYVDECRSEDLFHELELGGSVSDFCDEARRKSGCNATDEDICWAWNELLTGISVEKLRLIKHLHDDLGYKTAILSNTNEIHWKKSITDFFTIDGYKVEDYFDEVFLSYEMGVIKPDRRIFEAVTQRFNISPQDIFFIDDSQRNCEGARQCGITAFHDPTGTEWMHNLPIYAAALGNFDGVHRGHRYVLSKLCSTAKEYALRPIAITFDKHPRSLFDPTFNNKTLSTNEEKSFLLHETGVADVRILTFDRALASLSAYDFMKDVLRDKMGVKLLLLGYDNRFGKRNDTEDFTTYTRYGEELGIKVMQADPINVGDVRVSSSFVRHLVGAGKMKEAAECLGKPYFIMGRVAEGHQNGRKIGFPTVNIIPVETKLLPPNGVYASRTYIDGSDVPFASMTNIGHRPTYHGHQLTVETNIFDFNDDIYGKTIRIELLQFIRAEQPFDTPEQLREQLKKDKEVIQKL